MRLSTLFTKTLKEAPKDELSVNARLLMQAGFIDKLTAGVYTFLPLGLRVLKKIENIIREEMNKVGGQEILMPALTPKSIWETTGRWAAFDALFRLAGTDNKEYALGATHEEVVVPLAQKYVFSYKDLPLYIYQIQDKFRNEKRAKSGILRGREFIMKDLYSFHTDEADLDEYYKAMQKVYFKIFERCGLLDKTYLTFASGGSFSKYSHEFQTITPAGEDEIYICESCQIAVNKEIVGDLENKCPNCGNKNLKADKAIEVGNIFKLITKFSDPFGFSYVDEGGNKKPVIMGCFGLGLSRVLGTVAEVRHDDRGLVWPKEIAPFTVHLVTINSPDIEANNKIKLASEKIYRELQTGGIEVLFDDREGETSTGEKFADADLIGCPLRLVVSERTLEQDSVEVKNREEENKELVKISRVTHNI
ncbi:prolyl-tRNA synthetase [Candidatus Falkowbacteria bacterium CG10_big_fil_rev_8_21_14_0_10_43_11]|uniref:Proline--tRNA ligase n=1 Tax=Candidatus Falkowbacteria bacterium CG10_big_fil_rev_8_21_14_0_10_43_11 TaxID=1974568 RepID=A0A2M6WN62_9BACT|nr:MAG: prolyl-tRNA synthetase [Candidatus Falkowbacteria bacterium CG10_big_fil_rev_8_21_14_0_10_43_11]